MQKTIGGRSSGRGVGVAGVAVSASLWAVAAVVASDLFAAGVDPVDLTLARAVIAGAGFVALGGLSRAPRRRRLHPLRLLALGLSIALVNVTYYLAIDRLAVAVAIILQYTAPVIVVAWVAAIGRRLPPAEMLAALAAAVVGAALVSGFLTGEMGSIDALGIVFGLATAVFFAAYTVLSEPAGEAYGTLGAMARAFVVAGAFWIVVEATRGWPSELFAAANLPKVLFVGIGGTLVPFLIYVWALQRLGAERASIAATLEPVLAALVAWLWLDQSLLPAQIAGGVLVIAAVIALQLGAREPLRAPEP